MNDAQPHESAAALDRGSASASVIEARSVGVVVPAYGPLDEVARLLEAIVGPHVAPGERPGRVTVVDDAYPGEVNATALPSGVHYVKREVNGGFGAAVNVGLADLAAHDGIRYALVLNSDLHLAEGFLERLLQQATPFMPAVVGCRNEDESGHSGYAARHFPTVSQQVVEWLVPLASQRHRAVMHRAVGHNVRAERASGPQVVDWVSGSMMLLPLAEVLEAGGFNEDYFMYTEEVDLQKRLRERGVPAIYLPTLTVIHEGGGSSGGEERRRGWLTNARDLYARTHLNPHALRAGLYAATAVNFAWNSGRKLAGRDVDPKAVARFELGLLRNAREFAKDKEPRP